LLEHRLPPLADLAPRHVYYIASLSKCLSPSLRVAYVVSPDAQHSRTLEDLLRATMLSAAPIEEALAAHTMSNKSAFRQIARVRSEVRTRSLIVAAMLKDFRGSIRVGPLSVWLTLPSTWKRVEFVEALRPRGVAILSSDVFVLDAGEPKNAVRIATGAARDQQELRNALGAVVELLLSTSGLGIVQT